MSGSNVAGDTARVDRREDALFGDFQYFSAFYYRHGVYFEVRLWMLLYVCVIGQHFRQKISVAWYYAPDISCDLLVVS